MTNQQKKKTIIWAVIGLSFLAFLLVRVLTDKMIAPWPYQESVEVNTPVTNQFGVVIGEESTQMTRTTFKGFWTWIGAFFTICIMSFLYDDNPFYKFAEHVFVGVSAAYWMVLGFWNVIVPNLFGKLTPNLVSGIIDGVGGNKPQLLYIIPLLLGILLVLRLSSKFGVYSRWSLAFIVGTTAGLNFVQYLKSDFMNQIAASIVPFIVMTDGSFSAAATFGNWVIFVGVFCGLIYFFFSKEHTGAFGVASRVGIWVLMISFGASFGFTVMGRIALLVGRMEYILGEWLNLMGSG
jgi:hypothetical protein